MNGWKNMLRYNNKKYTSTMESFEQLNIHNQNVIKFGLFKIQTLK